MTSIGDFAESLISEELDGIKTGKVLPPSLQTSPTKNAPAGKDIRDIKVPNSFMQEVLGESYVPREEPIEEEPEIIQEEVEEIVEEVATASQERVEKLISLLEDVKSMLSEMTTTGAIGVNFAPSTHTKATPEYTTGGYKKPHPLGSKKKKKSRKGAMKVALSCKLRKIASSRVR